MARQVLPVVGAVIGAYFGNPQIGWMIGSIVGNAVDPQVMRGPSLGDAPAQTAQDGVFLPFGYGRWVTAGNIMDRSEPRIIIQEDQQGKGGGPVTETERELRDYAIRICESIEGTASEVVAITRVWENEKLVYDVTPGSTIQRESAEWLEGVRFYYGTESQLPDSTLETIHGSGNVPSYRGRCYAVFVAQDVTDKGRAIPQYRFEVVTVGTTTSINWLASGTPLADGLVKAGSGIASWTSLGTQSSSGYVYNYRGVIYRGEISYSTDSGTTWVDSNSPFPQSGPKRLLFIGGYAFLCSGVHPLQRYASGAWSQMSGSTLSRANTAVYHGGAIIVASLYNSNITASTDLGQTWETRGLLDATPSSWSMVLGSDGADLIVLMTPGLSSGLPITIKKSTDDGATWSSVHTIALGATAGAGDVLHNGSGWIAGLGDGRVLYSSDGTSWSLSATTLSDGVIQLASAYGLVVAICADGAVYKSTDNGASWTLTPTTSLTVGTGVTFTDPSTTVTPGTVDLATIVTDICDRAGVLAATIDVTELTDLVRGYAVRNEYQAAASIRPLQRTYFFDSYDADGKTWFPKRGGSSVVTITADDLVDDPEIDNDHREQEIEYPKSLHLIYTSAETGHAQADQVSQRSSTDLRVRGDMTVEAPLVLSDDEAAQIADKLHKVAWVDLRGEVKIPVPSNYSWLTPSDIITLDYNSRIRRLRIERKNTGDGVIELICRHERQSNYTSDVTGNPYNPPIPPTPTYPGETDFVWLNLPVIDDSQDILSWAIGVAGAEEGWVGARVDLSLDDGVTYNPVATVTNGATIGTLLASLPIASAYTTDTQNELRLALIGPADTLESASRAQVLRSANGIAVAKADGTVEIVQFQDVTEESDNVWVCTTLLRGRKNTTPATHAAGARALLLTSAVIVPASSAQIDADLWLRATSLGNAPDDSEEFVRTYTPAVSQTEWAPCYLRTSRSGNDLTATWSPRPRLGDSRLPFESSNFNGYRVTLTKGANSVTFDQTATTFTYDTSALGSAPVDISIRGINRITGVGDELTGSA